MVVEGVGMGRCRLFLPGFRCTDGQVPRRRVHAQFACKEKVEGWVSRNWTPAAGVWVERQGCGKSRGLLRVCAPAPFNPGHPVTALARSRERRERERETAGIQDTRGVGGAEGADRMRVGNRAISRRGLLSEIAD